MGINVDLTEVKVDSSVEKEHQLEHFNEGKLSCWIRKYIKHLLHCALFLSVICLTEYFTFSNQPRLILNPWAQYGVILTCVLYTVRVITLLPLPQAIFNFFGLIAYNTFPGKVTLNSSPLLSPLICIRVVTRGDYPELVRKNTIRNIEVCLDAGLDNFFFEVVSDRSIDLNIGQRLREIVVPENYKSSKGALYKARALQYCLEEKANILSDNDWIVHMDEETLLTADSIKGILNFIIEGKYHIGQGLITYANEKIVNWLTTLADNFRVTDDMGKLRLQFKFFHKPLFSFKGSFVVTQYGTEKTVSFDHGPKGSIAEDCYFAIKAFSMGYTFDFIEGEMWEKSPFTIKDFIRQRKRWLEGILLVIHSKALPIKYKFLLGVSCYAWISMPLALSNLVLVPRFPVPSVPILDFLMTFVGAVNIYMFIFGALKSFSPKRWGRVTYCFILLGSVLVVPINAIVENIAVLWGAFGKKNQFYVVQKNV